MKRSCLGFLFLLSGLFAAQSSAQTASSDSAYARAQRMVSDGDASGGRAVIDSMLRSAGRGSPAYAEALFWRASLATTAQQSEQDYRRLIVEYPLYARTGDVLLRLAQLELFRGNRGAAIVHLRRIQTEHPEFANQAAASYWLGKALFEKNDVNGACGAIAEAKRLVKPEDIELKNQIDYQDQQCAGVVVTIATDSTEQPAIGSQPTLPVVPPTTPPVRAADSRENQPSTAAVLYSVQVAAYNKQSQAKTLAAKLAKRGFAARVDGTKAPYRVRIGKYKTRAEASAAQQRIKKSGISGILVKAD